MPNGFIRSEVVIGLVAPVGVDLSAIERVLATRLEHYDYLSVSIRMSKLIENVSHLGVPLHQTPHGKRLLSYMEGGTAARALAKRGDFLALAAMKEISHLRNPSLAPMNRAYIVRSFKHPDEADTFRRIYGAGFYLIGVHSSRANRFRYLTKNLNISKADANTIITIDEAEGPLLGQRTRDAFHLADAFVSVDDPHHEEQLWRLLDILFGHPHHTPTRDEYAMFLAYAASLRSGDLSRQVGAVITRPDGDILATGANDVPRFGGGLYWADDKNDERDAAKGYDSNQRERDHIIINVMTRLAPDLKTDTERLQKGAEVLKDTGLPDITEYGRAVHAEMEAILSCARTGVSPRGAYLYSTTFPCHNCAKHLVAAGIVRVVYIEPYPKSKASELHRDSICLSDSTREDGKTYFEPFIGIGPRHFMSLFSMRIGCHSPKERKEKETGAAAVFSRRAATLRNQLSPMSYLEMEHLAMLELDGATGGTADA